MSYNVNTQITHNLFPPGKVSIEDVLQGLEEDLVKARQNQKEILDSAKLKYSDMCLYINFQGNI